jgi:hypothetical protein
VGMGNVLSKAKREQVIALGRLGWSLRRIEQATGVRRETASDYLRSAGITIECDNPTRILAGGVIELYDLSPEVVIHSLHEQATAIGRDLLDLLKTLVKIFPDFANLIKEELGI